MPQERLFQQPANPSEVFAFHFYRRGSLALDGFRHSPCYGAASRADALHNGVIFLCASHDLTRFRILVFYTDLAFILTSGPYQGK